MHFLKTSYWTFTNTSLGYLYIALHLNHTHTHVCFSSFGVAMKRNWKWVHTHFCNNTGCHMCWLIFNFLPLLRNQIELLIIGKCLSCTFSRALDTCFFSHPSWDWCFGKQRFTFSVDESFCEKHGSVEVCSAAQCLLSLCLHVDDKLIALRPGHSSSLSPAQFAPVCSQRSWMPSEGSTYSGGRWKALLDFWAFANFHEWSSLCWWAFFPHQPCGHHLKWLKIPKDCLVQSTIPASPWELKKVLYWHSFGKIHRWALLCFKVQGLAFSFIIYAHSTQ